MLTPSKCQPLRIGANKLLWMTWEGAVKGSHERTLRGCCERQLREGVLRGRHERVSWERTVRESRHRKTWKGTVGESCETEPWEKALKESRERAVRGSRESKPWERAMRRSLERKPWKRVVRELWEGAVKASRERELWDGALRESSESRERAVRWSREREPLERDVWGSGAVRLQNRTSIRSHRGRELTLCDKVCLCCHQVINGKEQTFQLTISTYLLH